MRLERKITRQRYLFGTQSGVAVLMAGLVFGLWYPYPYNLRWARGVHAGDVGGRCHRAADRADDFQPRQAAPQIAARLGGGGAAATDRADAAVAAPVQRRQ